MTAGGGQGFCVNLSVDTSSVDIMELARQNGALYIDTVNEPWAGFYFDASKGPGARTNYVLREETLAARARNPGGPTAVSCCGANPGMVSWFVKQALLDLARDLAIEAGEPATQQDWARLMQRVGVKGIHIAERDTQRATSEKPMQVFVNTWSVEGFVSEGMQPAELGWGTHERWLPEQRRPAGPATASRSTSTSPAPTRACGAGARRPARNTASSSRTTNRSRSRTSSRCARATGWRTARPATTPTTRATRRCCRCTRCSARAGRVQERHHILTEDEIVDGIDELGVLLYGHGRNAYWYGSQLSIEETRRIAPYQNATGLQVTSAVLAGMVWALENPKAGIVEADEIDFRRCLEVQRPYLGPVTGVYTDWTPLEGRPGFFAEDIDTSDPWQFRNVLVR